MRGGFGDVETLDLLVECTYLKNSGVIRIGKHKVERTVKYGEKRGKIPLLVIGIKNTGEKYVILRFNDFMRFYKAYEKCKRLEETFSFVESMVSGVYDFKLYSSRV